MSEIQYSLSAKTDYIINHLLKNKENQDIIRAIPYKIYKFPFDPTEDLLISQWFIDSPDDFAALVKTAILQHLAVIKNQDAVDQAKKNLSVIITNARKIKMHEWGPEHEGFPVSVDAMIVSQNKPETYTKFAKLVCKQGHILEVRSLDTDTKCSICEEPMKIDPASVKTGYIRSVLIQEPVDEAKHGKITIFDAVIKDDDVRMTYIGQRVNIIGVFRSIPQKYKTTNKIVISILSVKSLEDIQEIQPTAEQIERFKQLSQQQNYVNVLAESIAPQIKHETLSKICVLIALVGSPEKDLQRDMIHFFMVGDPSTGKTDIQEYILFLVKKSAMAVGGTMSGSGVTVTMDTLPNRLKLPRAGIVPLCNKGVVAIDELNQLEDEDIGKLYEAMESGTIHYNKGGFDLELEAKTTIIAGANPKHYVYNNDHSIVDNLNLPAPLISRFDLITNMQRGTKSSIDRQEIIDHINLIDRIGLLQYIKQSKLLETAELAAFISYAKSFNPTFTAIADKVAKDFQLHMESMKQQDGSLAIDIRFYYSIKRISKAIARIYFSNEVTSDHVMLAIEIKKKTLQTFGMNTEAGQLQMKVASDVRGKEQAFITVLRHLEEKNPDGRFGEDEAIKALFEQYPEYFFSMDKAAVEFGKAYNAGKISKQNGRYKLD